MDQINRYGSRYNVNHPLIRRYYLRFKQKIGVPEHFPISDAQRQEFEGYMDGLQERGKLPQDVFNQCPEGFGQYLRNSIAKENDL